MEESAGAFGVEEGRDPKSEPSKLLKGNRILIGFD